MKDKFLKKMTDFWVKYEFKIVLFLGLILIAGMSFEAGYLKGKTGQRSPLMVEYAAPQANSEVADNQAENIAAQLIPQKPSEDKKECLYVGSKNSDKYHTPTCRFAKNIKPENRICFSSKEDAEQKGYQPDKACVK